MRDVGGGGMLLRVTSGFYINKLFEIIISGFRSDRDFNDV